MTRRVFITGTDTGVGKTFIACALARALRERGASVAALKPIETGCESRAGELFAADAEALADAVERGVAGGRAPGTVFRSADAKREARGPAQAAGGKPDRTPSHSVAYTFAAPLAPLAAAEAEGVSIDLARLDAAVAAAEQRAAGGVVVIEGAGGLLVPVRAGVSMADLAARWSCELVIVARAGLGTINHTLLTVEAARAWGLPITGVVLNDATPAGTDDPSRAGNAALIERCGAVEVVARVAHGPADGVAAELDKLVAKLLA